MEKFRFYTIKGPAAQIDKFCATLAASLPTDWTSDAIPEPAVKGTYHNFKRPASGAIPKVSVALLVKDNLGQADVANIVPDGRSLTVAEYNSVLAEFIELANPLAETLGLTTEET